MITFIKHYIPASYTRTRPGRKMTPTSITIHETDNTNVRANARAHALLQANGNKRQASWHVQVDDEREVYVSIPFTEAAFHSGTYNGNHTSIAIEICVNKDGDYNKALLNAIEVVKYLKNKYPSIKQVVQHHHWSRKNCPRILRSNTEMSWQNFLTLTTSTETSASTLEKPYKTTNHTFKKGQKVLLKSSAKHYATGERIPKRYKNKTYTIQQKGSNRMLLKELYSWVKTSDLTTKHKPTNTFAVGDSVKINSSANKYSRSTAKIPMRYKNNKYTIQQVGKDDVLIKELYSWVKKSDINQKLVSHFKSDLPFYYSQNRHK